MNKIFVKTCYALCLFLLVPFSTATADDQLQKSQGNEYFVGPWRLGMTRSEVSAFESHGPYVPVKVTGGVETFNAVLNGKKENISFVFDGNGRLDYIQDWKYEGLDYAEAKKAALDIFDLFTSRFGGAEIKNIQVNGQNILDRSGMDAVLDKLIGQAPELSEKISADATKKDGKKIITTFTFDLVPVNQPSNCRLHSQLIYSSKFKTFYIFLFQDPVNSKSREMKANIRADFDQ